MGGRNITYDTMLLEKLFMPSYGIRMNFLVSEIFWSKDMVYKIPVIFVLIFIYVIILN